MITREDSKVVPVSPTLMAFPKGHLGEIAFILEGWFPAFPLCPTCGQNMNFMRGTVDTEGEVAKRRADWCCTDRLCRAWVYQRDDKYLLVPPSGEVIE